MRALAGLAVLLMGEFGSVTPADAASCTLAGLQWMKGAWRYDGDGEQNEAVWTGASENRLIGSAWSLHADRAGGGIEASTIQIESKKITLHLRHFTSDLGLAREDTDTPMMFTATACAEDSVTFDGQGSARGQHVSYRRQGDQLTVASDLNRQGRPGKVEIAFTKTSE